MSRTVTADNVDLSNCDREQVQFSGAVQPHGCLVVLSEPSMSVLQASANTADLLGVGPEELRRCGLGAVLGARTRDIISRLEREELGSGPVHIACLDAEQHPGARPLNLFAHRSAAALILEFEVIPAGAEQPMLDLHSGLRATIARLQATPTLQSFLKLAVTQIRLFTGFERVMAYKFLEDGTGHVMAECNADGFAPYLGLHFPASDIPAPARRLFTMAWLRHLPNVDYEPAPLIPQVDPRTGEPVDLSCAFLRSVSVMYTGYLKNMGAKATMVMPLMKDGKLWGLISCMHESEPRHVPYGTRMAAEFLAHMLSLMMSAKEDAETLSCRLRTRAVLDRMMATLNERADLHAVLAGGDDGASIASYIEANGAALVTREKVTCLGTTPPEEEIRRLAERLAQGEELITATDRLGELYPDTGRLAATAAGLLAVRLAKRRPEYVMWFRPEQAQTVAWAGDPNKPVEVDSSDGSIRLMPRTSFAIWKQDVAGRSRPWAEREVKAAADLRSAIVEMILQKAEETELLNRSLQDTNVELDSFAYVASHDLKEPLRGIHHMATFLKRGEGDPAEQTDTILRLTKRMDDLIESLLRYSHTGRVDLSPADCDLDTLLDEALLGLAARIRETGTQIRRPAKLPPVTCDRARTREVLTNLVSNAVKYNDKAQRWVEIGTLPSDPLVLFVRDNGIGIPERYHERIFEIFRRLHTRDEFGGGTGAGLTIAKRTIERHGGRIWLESVVGEGTTFYFTLQPDHDG